MKFSMHDVFWQVLTFDAPAPGPLSGNNGTANLDLDTAVEVGTAKDLINA